ncbi:hypothetical protein [Streptomyces sp. UNOB3_S3]|nr:hypothetical protein [Streptomyces sp. UNOB3_S3]MCC3776490.1 hypothetical protein [Streptomyces sp. UNOB3_S3]
MRTVKALAALVPLALGAVLAAPATGAVAAGKDRTPGHAPQAQAAAFG